MELAKIHGKFNANDVTFKKGTWFDRATFNGETSFDKAIFNKRATFFDATFNGETWFYDVTFKEETWFNGATFNKGASFNRATFNGETSFDKAIFNGETLFFGATFNKRASFNESQFRNKTIFDGSFFSEEVSFKNTIFLIGSINNSKYIDYVSFGRVSFEKPQQVIFDGCNMKRVSFMHTDISRIMFINTKWGKDFRIFDEKLFLLKLNKEKEKFIKEQKKLLKKIISIKLDDVIKDFKEGKTELSEEMEEIIYEPTIYQKLKELKEKENVTDDYKNKVKNELTEKYKEYIKRLEEKLKNINQDLENEIEEIKKDEDLTLDNVLTVYKNFRENYDYYMKYEESGKFFLNEMRLKRKTLPKLSGEKIVMLLYEVLSLYGESYIRSLLALITIMMTSFFIRLYVHQFDPNVIFDELLKSIDLFGVGSVSGSIDIIERSIDIIERLAAIPILGMLIVALRRKLERRVRH
jgi:hypothetical protein